MGLIRFIGDTVAAIVMKAEPDQQLAGTNIPFSAISSPFHLLSSQ